MSKKWTPDSVLEEWFSYHPPSSPQIAEAHQQVRDACLALARTLSDLLPECPDKTVALRAIRTVMYEANACLAVEQEVFKK